MIGYELKEELIMWVVIAIIMGIIAALITNKVTVGLGIMILAVMFITIGRNQEYGGTKVGEIVIELRQDEELMLKEVTEHLLRENNKYYFYNPILEGKETGKVDKNSDYIMTDTYIIKWDVNAKSTDKYVGEFRSYIEIRTDSYKYTNEPIRVNVRFEK